MRGTIGGGYSNVIHANTDYCTIAGGDRNFISFYNYQTTIGGGAENTVDPYSEYATIAGGARNVVHGNIFSYALGSTISGGADNTSTGPYSTIPGGLNNYAASHGFAAGTRGRADHQGAFVWSDSSAGGVSSSAINQFTARASGGIRFFTDAGATTGAELSPGAGSWSSLSDRNAKTNFVQVKPREVLQRLAGLRINEWSYKAQDPNVRHIGPTAQDFHAAFAVGEDERRISSVDADGVALAAIQGLHSLLREKEKEIDTLKNRLTAIEAMLTKGSR
jgi:hypothetical protein